MNTPLNGLINWSERVACHFDWFAPLLARFAVGWVFLWSGWGKLTHLPKVTENFVRWGIPYPEILTPFVSGVELVGGALLLLGLFTRFAAVPLAIVMIVAIRTALWGDVDSLGSLLGLEEFLYLVIFLWLAIAGPGVVALDHLLQRSKTPKRRS